MDLDAKLDLITRVGRELVRLELHGHAAHARRLYATVRAGREPGMDEWSMDMIVTWARTLRLPPHEHDWPVREYGHQCCDAPRTYVSGTWPGGSRTTCEACGVTWMVLDRC